MKRPKSPFMPVYSQPGDLLGNISVGQLSGPISVKKGEMRGDEQHCNEASLPKCLCSTEEAQCTVWCSLLQ